MPWTVLRVTEWSLVLGSSHTTLPAATVCTALASRDALLAGIDRLAVRHASSV